MKAPRAKTAPNVSEFIAELIADDAQTTVYTGLVKATDDADPQALMFARMDDPTHWVRLSGDAIAKIEKLPDVTILGRLWKAARVSLKAPSTPAEVSLSNLAAFHQLSLASAIGNLIPLELASRTDTVAPVGDKCPDGYTKIYDTKGFPHCIKDQES